MKLLWKKNRFSAKFIAELLEKWRWLILAVIGISLLWVEVLEFRVLRVLDQPFHYFEVVQYAILLVSTGLFVELFARSNHAHKQAVKILQYKHHISQELASNDDWESLIQKIAELPGELVKGVDESYLLVNDPISGNYEPAGHWISADRHPRSVVWDPTIPCKKCLEKTSGNGPSIHLCRDANDTSSYYIYSLGIINQNIPGTILKFRLKSGNQLSQDEEEIFQHLGDEITVALRVNQERKRLSEMQSAKVAIAERRTVSAYVHDQLGQNLGYLHLKLDQLGANENILESKDIRKDLKHLQEVANESYEIVRDILKSIQPDTTPNLTNLLKEHARKVSRRSGFTLEFKSMGEPVPVTTDTQQSIFFTFREILSNVEKHANASKVEVLIVWNGGLLDISVADDGRGFNPRLVRGDEHFGLEIMQERITSIKGNLVIDSSTDSGTVVSLSIPLESAAKVPE